MLPLCGCPHLFNEYLLGTCVVSGPGLDPGNPRRTGQMWALDSWGLPCNRATGTQEILALRSHYNREQGQEEKLSGGSGACQGVSADGGSHGALLRN